MTGTGTQSDPFIVDNWADFRTIDTSSSDIYVIWADSENKIIDFNDIQPDGFSSTVNFPANVDFNGWTLRNFHSTASSSIACNGMIQNLILENFYTTSSTLIYGSVLFKNCIFSGIIQSAGNAYMFHGGGITECSMNIRVNTTGWVEIASGSGFSSPKTQITNSDLILDISCGSDLEISSYRIKNSRISGKFQTSASSCAIGDSTSMSNVFNIESNVPLKYLGSGISVYNSDLAKSHSYSSSALKPCTSGQLKDAQYLYSIGFPIGVD